MDFSLARSCGHGSAYYRFSGLAPIILPTILILVAVIFAVVVVGPRLGSGSPYTSTTQSTMSPRGTSFGCTVTPDTRPHGSWSRRSDSCD